MEQNEEPLYEQLADLAMNVEDDALAEQMIHLAAKVRTLELSQDRIKREAAAEALETAAEDLSNAGYSTPDGLRARAAVLRSEVTR